MLTSFGLDITVENKFKDLKHEVQLLLFLQEADCYHCREIKRLFEKLASITHKINLDVYNFAIDKEVAGRYNIKRVPAIAVIGNRDFRIRYYCFPEEVLFYHLLDSIVEVSHGTPSISTKNKKFLEGLDTLVQLELFISPTCAYSWPAEKTALRLAMASDKINLDIIDAMKFQEVAEQYNIHGIPMTIVNGKECIFGALHEEDFIRALIERITDYRIRD